MVARDTPQISSSAYSNTTYAGDGSPAGWGGGGSDTSPVYKSPQVHHHRRISAVGVWPDYKEPDFDKLVNAAVVRHGLNPQEEEMVARIVKIVIVDNDENIPLDQRLLYNGDEKFTDLTDQELFFEIDIKGILDKHNEARVKIVNKKVKERTEYLEKVRIKDLKMVVVEVAKF